MIRSKRRLATCSEEAIVETMADGDRETQDFLEKYIKDNPKNVLWLDVLDTYCIYGKNIFAVYMYCDKSVQAFTEMLMGLDKGEYGTYPDQRKIVKDIINEVALEVG